MVRRRSTVRFRKGARETDARRRRVIRLQRYLINPPTKLAVWLGLVPDHALIETVGRKTGKRRRTVVGCHRDGDLLWVVAEQGRHAGYVRNLEAQPRIRVRLGRRWYDATAVIVEDDDPLARLGSFSARHAALVQRFGTSLLTVRIDLGGNAPR